MAAIESEEYAAAYPAEIDRRRLFFLAVVGGMPLERRDGDWNGFVRIVLAKLLAPMCRLCTRARSPG